MLRDPPPPQHALEMVTLEDLVPADHLVRKIARTIDFEFIRDEVRHLYCADNGRPPVDPVRLFKIMLLGYIFGIKSERQLVKEIAVNVAYRWFLGMSLTEKVIDASTLSKNRQRRFNQTDVFERIFERIVEQAIEKGLVGGDAFFTDSTHVKADANSRKCRIEERPVRGSVYLDMIEEAVAEDRRQSGKDPLKPTTKNTTVKKTKVSTTDPDSGYMHRDQKPKGFFYLDHRTVDGRCNIILDTFITPGNVNDTQPYIARLDHTIATFGMQPTYVGLDAGYFSAPVCEALERRFIQGIFGYRRPSPTKNAIKKKHFRYDETTDVYICPEGATLSYRTTTRDGYRNYRSSANVCARCPRLSECTTSQTKTRTIARHVMQKSIDLAHERRLSETGKRLYRRRCETVERSFADAKQHHGHRYIRFRGRLRAQMQAFLAATAQNIKKIALILCLLMQALLMALRREWGQIQEPWMTCGKIRAA